MPFKKDKTEYVNMAPIRFKFKTFDVNIWERIVYIQHVLDNSSRYLGAPSRKDLLIELKGLLKQYSEFIKAEIDKAE